MMSVVGQVGRTLSFLECLPSVLRCRRRSEASRASQGSSTGTRRSATQNGEGGKGGKGSRQKSWQRRSKSWQRHGGRGLARPRAKGNKNMAFSCLPWHKRLFPLGPNAGMAKSHFAGQKGPTTHSKVKMRKKEEKKGSRGPTWTHSSRNQSPSGAGA